MADTFTTSLSIRQIETGTRSGTWGTETNTQYELLDNAFSYVANDLASDADATLTISDGTASNARYFYIKFTSSVSLTATRTITLAPDDSSKIWIVENATTGSQALTFKQGSSGSTVTVSNGNTAMIYADGAGATNGAITNAFTDLQLAGTTSVAGLDAGSGSITTTGTVTGNTLAGTLSTAAQPNITSVGTLTGFTSTGIDDNATSTAITIDSSERVGIGTTNPSSGDGILNLETSSSTILNCNGTDANGGFIKFQRSGTTKGYVGTPAGFLGGGDADDFGIRAQADFTIATGGANERLRITSAGSVGINTTSPSNKLTINSTTGSGLKIYAADQAYARLTLDNLNGQAWDLVAGTAGASNSGFGIYDGDAGATRLQIDSSGNIGIGTNSPNARLDVATSDSKVAEFERTGTAVFDLTVGDVGPGAAQLFFNAQTNDTGFVFRPKSSGGTTTNALLIDPNGDVGIGNTSPTHRLDVINNKANFASSRFISTSAATTEYGLSIILTNSPNDATRYFMACTDSVTTRAVIRSNGGFESAVNSYGGISDVKLKENIVDASDKLEDLKRVRIRNYNLIGSDVKQIGVIAQELETVFPSMVEETIDLDENNNELDTTTKNVKYSVFVPILIKALQEQQTIIEDLKARITTLENA